MARQFEEPYLAPITEVLKVERDRRRHRARRNIVGAAEGREEIVQRRPVGHVNHRQAQANLLAVALEKIVVAYRDIEQVAWGDRKSVVEGKSVDLGGRRIIKK